MFRRLEFALRRVILLNIDNLEPQSSYSIGNESVPIQLALCRFRGLVISNAKM